MKFLAKFLKRTQTEDGKTELTLLVENWQAQAIIRELIKGIDYRVEINEVKSKRSLQANNLMWELIHQINIAINGTRANAEGDWEIYILALERAGAKFEYIAALPETEHLLKENFRAIKKLSSFEYNGKTFNSYMVFYGSSKMNTKEMSLLIETVKDIAVECNVDISVYEGQL